MSLIPLYDASGNPLLDSGGNQIYTSYSGPSSERTAIIEPESRIVDVINPN